MYSRLGKKVTIAVLTATVLTSVISASIQVRMELKNDVDALQNRLDRIDESFIDSVSNAVWQVDENKTVFLLKILQEKLELTSVILSSPDLGDIVLGEKVQNPTLTRKFPLLVQGRNNDPKDLGVLTVSLSMQSVYDQLQKRILFIVAINIVRTVVLAILLLLIANQFVTKRLKEFSNAINQFPKQVANSDASQKQSIRLSRPPLMGGIDEIDELAETYVNLRKLLIVERRKLDSSNTVLAQKVQELENAVDEKTAKETELTIAKKKLEAAMRAKSVFVANTSHELRTPLTAILGFLEIIDQNLDNTEEVRKCLKIVDRNSKQLLDLVNDVLTFSGSDEHGLRLNFSAINLIEFLKEAVENIRNLAESKKIALTIEILLDDDVVIRSDPHRIRQVLNNLIGNAVKFTEKGFVKVTCRQRKSKQPENFAIQISVEDSGIGIGCADKFRVFEPFVQSDDSHTRSFGGSGLGLTISKKVAQLLGGDVILNRSLPGHGSEFVFSFEGELVSSAPLMASDSPPIVSQKPDNMRSYDSHASLFAQKKFVVVDDNPDNLALISAILNRIGATVLAAHDGKSGFDTAMKNQPDLVLMDIQMPGINGYTTVQNLRASGFNQPIIAVTAKADESEEARCINSGFDGLITKPIDIERMITLIQEKLA